MKIMYWLQFAAVVVVAVILFFGIYRGVSSGILSGKSEIVLTNTRTIVKGLDYFYADQNRYPSQEEFGNTNLMLAYLTGYPPIDISGGVCTTSYGYHSLDFKTYELHFCLPVSVEKFPAGLNIAKR